MELQLVNFEQAKALKELGFPQLVNENIHCQYVNGLLDYCEDACFLEFDDNVIYAPTLELVAKWLRDEKNINIMIDNFDGRMAGFSEVSYMYIMSYIKPIKSLHNCYTMYDTWEQALSAGIDKAIEILKNNE